jgi:hypothetical protein
VLARALTRKPEPIEWDEAGVKPVPAPEPSRSTKRPLVPDRALTGVRASRPLPRFPKCEARRPHSLCRSREFC